MPHPHRLLLLAVSCLQVPISALSADYNWDGPAAVPGVIEGGSGEWNFTNQNWVGPVFPEGTGQTTYQGGNVVFGGAPGVVDVTANVAASRMVFNTGGYTFNLATGCNMRVNGGITSSQVSEPLFTLNGGTQTMSIAGESTSSGQAAVVNSGTLQLELLTTSSALGTNSSLDIRGGTVRLQFVSGNAFFSSTVRFSGSTTLDLRQAAKVTLIGPIAIAAGAVIRGTGDQTASLYAKSLVTLEGDATINTTSAPWSLAPEGAYYVDLAGHTLTLTGTASIRFGSGGGFPNPVDSVDRMRGSGRIVVQRQEQPTLLSRASFSGTNSFSGGVLLESGTLAILHDAMGNADAPTAGPIGTGTLTIASGAIEGGFSPVTIKNRIELLGDFSVGTVETTGNIELAGTLNLGSALARTITVDGKPRALISGAITGAPNTGLVKNGGRELDFTGSNANTYTGTTTVLQGTLGLSKTVENSAIPGALVIGDSGPGASSAIVLLFRPEQIANDARVTLNGGRLQTATSRETAGVLALLSDSTLDFYGQPIGSSTLTFSTFENPGHSILRIENWYGDLSGGGEDQLRFTTLDTQLLDSFEFANYPPGAAAIDYGTYLEVVPAVPEPCSTMIIGTSLLCVSFRRPRAVPTQV